MIFQAVRSKEKTSPAQSVVQEYSWRTTKTDGHAANATSWKRSETTNNVKCISFHSMHQLLTVILKMKIYTKTGDKGTTSKYDGTRVPKDDPLIVVISRVDSLLASLDTAIVSIKDEEIVSLLEQIQTKLWQTAGEISLGGTGRKVKDEITSNDIEFLEKSIDKYYNETNVFIRFRTESAVRLNEARIRTRELEVALTSFYREGKIRQEIYQYLNRLSDLLFALSCNQNKV